MGDTAHEEAELPDSAPLPATRRAQLSLAWGPPISCSCSRASVIRRGPGLVQPGVIAAFRLQSGGVVAGTEHLLDGATLFRRAGEQPLGIGLDLREER
ncbi:hypothetical protein ACFRAO_41570 [Streptomyces sp. NPDC056656]|uniref:hypothetical protein n=1 Tax=Streptomyces sp. NPDC056656 TaxID=3345895 RepID=UPI0036B2A54F